VDMMSVMATTDNQISFTGKDDSAFREFWKSCDSPTILNDGKFNFFIKDGFKVVFMPMV
jgi:hypothetical protein